MRKKIVAGNWKMNKTRDEALQFIYAVSQATPSADLVESIIFAPSIFLRCLVKRRGEELKIGAQNVHQVDSGPYTGEISPTMIKTTGVSHILIGHSERRRAFAETDQLVNMKLLATLDHGMIPVVCCGEELEDFQAGKTLEFLKGQITRMFHDVAPELVENIIIAYEPIWAIGTGKTPTPLEVEETVTYIRERIIAKLYTPEIANKVRIIYGGSVTTANVNDFIKGNVDGILAGGASLDPQSFLSLVDSHIKK